MIFRRFGGSYYIRFYGDCIRFRWLWEEGVTDYTGWCKSHLVLDECQLKVRFKWLLRHPVQEGCTFLHGMIKSWIQFTAFDWINVYLPYSFFYLFDLNCMEKTIDEVKCTVSIYIKFLVPSNGSSVERCCLYCESGLHYPVCDQLSQGSISINNRCLVKSLTLRLLMSYIYIYIYIYIYGAPILDVSRSHTTTHHSR